MLANSLLSLPNLIHSQPEAHRQSQLTLMNANNKKTRAPYFAGSTSAAALTLRIAVKRAFHLSHPMHGE
jgi:hypothetical protein